MRGQDRASLEALLSRSSVTRYRLAGGRSERGPRRSSIAFSPAPPYAPDAICHPIEEGSVGKNNGRKRSSFPLSDRSDGSCLSESMKPMFHDRGTINQTASGVRALHPLSHSCSEINGAYRRRSVPVAFFQTLVRTFMRVFFARVMFMWRRAHAERNVKRNGLPARFLCRGTETDISRAF